MTIAEQDNCRTDTETDNIDQRVELAAKLSLLFGATFHFAGDNAIAPVKKGRPEQADHRRREITQESVIDSEYCAEQPGQRTDVRQVFCVAKYGSRRCRVVW